MRRLARIRRRPAPRHEEQRELLVASSDGHHRGRRVLLVRNVLATLLLLVAFSALGYAVGAVIAEMVPTEAHSSPVDLKANKQLQIANYIDGTALLLNVHITHHAGTSVCHLMKTLGPAPGFACMRPGIKAGTNQEWPEGMPTPQLGHRKAWSYRNTATYAARFRKLFHFVSQEYGYRMLEDLHRTDWESDNLVSMIVMRHPLERFLSGGRGGKCGDFHNGWPMALTDDPTNETQALYWEYANAECADNYALRVLANTTDCVEGAETTIACLESAKEDLLRRFTFILDQSCLSESMVELGRRLHLNITKRDLESDQHRKHPPTVRERLGNDTLYEYLQERFRRDIALYEWSKTQSVVQCD